MKTPIDPPAIVKSADVRAELAPKIRAAYKRTEEESKQLGQWLLQCKEACAAAREPWNEWLKRETGIPRPTATRWMYSVNKRADESATAHVSSSGQDESEIPDEPADEQEEEPAESQTAPDLLTIVKYWKMFCNCWDVSAAEDRRKFVEKWNPAKLFGGENV